MEDQGLYRIVGVTSKVNRLLTQGLDKKKIEKLNFDDVTEVESKTVCIISINVRQGFRIISGLGYQVRCLTIFEF